MRHNRAEGGRGTRRRRDRTLILVSHDREFLDGLVNNVYEFKDHKINRFIGNIYDFLQKKKIDSPRQLEQKENKKGPGSNIKTGSSGRENYIKKKEVNKKIRILINKISKCENSIEELENEMTILAGQLGSQDPSDGILENNALFIKYGELKKTLDLKMDDWEILHSEFEDLKKSPYYK